MGEPRRYNRPASYRQLSARRNRRESQFPFLVPTLLRGDAMSWTLRRPPARPYAPAWGRNVLDAPASSCSSLRSGVGTQCLGRSGVRLLFAAWGERREEGRGSGRAWPERSRGHTASRRGTVWTRWCACGMPSPPPHRRPISIAPTPARPEAPASGKERCRKGVGPLLRGSPLER